LHRRRVAPHNPVTIPIDRNNPARIHPTQNASRRAQPVKPHHPPPPQSDRAQHRSPPRDCAPHRTIHSISKPPNHAARGNNIAATPTGTTSPPPNRTSPSQKPPPKRSIRATTNACPHTTTPAPDRRGQNRDSTRPVAITVQHAANESLAVAQLRFHRPGLASKHHEPPRFATADRNRRDRNRIHAPAPSSGLEGTRNTTRSPSTPRIPRWPPMVLAKTAGPHEAVVSSFSHPRKAASVPARTITSAIAIAGIQTGNAAFLTSHLAAVRLAKGQTQRRHHHVAGQRHRTAPPGPTPRRLPQQQTATQASPAIARNRHRRPNGTESHARARAPIRQTHNGKQQRRDDQHRSVP